MPLVCVLFAFNGYCRAVCALPLASASGSCPSISVQLVTLSNYTKQCRKRSMTGCSVYEMIQLQNMSAKELQREADPCGSSLLATAVLFALVTTVTQVGECAGEPDGGSSATAVH